MWIWHLTKHGVVWWKWWSDLEGVDPFSVARGPQRLSSKRCSFSILWEAHESPPCLMIQTPSLRPRGNPTCQGVRNKSYCNRRQRIAEDGRGWQRMAEGEERMRSPQIHEGSWRFHCYWRWCLKKNITPAQRCACCDVFHCWGAAKAILPMTVEAKDGRRNVQTWLKCQEMWRVLASKRIFLG